VDPGAALGPGVYRVINYGGELFDNGLTIGSYMTAPASPGEAPVVTGPLTGFSVQVSIPGQVNLINTTGLTLTYWDGEPAINENNSVIDGGSGIWLHEGDTDNWTNSTGAINDDWAEGQFAIFAGASGTVTVSDDNGQVQASGMQFMTDGYVIAGDSINLVDSTAAPDFSVIRVGDGTEAGAAITATINSVLSGSTTLEKTDLGTLVLGGVNTYSGGTLIEGGVVQIASDANLGAGTGGLTLDGGTLRTTADITSARATTLGANGGVFETLTGTTFTLNGAVSGGGSLTKTGAGTTVLTAANSYSGGTTISAGTLQLGSGGATGSIVGDVANSGILAFNRSNTYAFGGIVSGTGSLEQIGAGTTILTAANTYTGGTTISDGTLQLGNGGATGSIVGNVLTEGDGTLAFDRSNTYVFGGVVSGTGSLSQIGAGTTILTAANTYTGGTTISDGTLQLGNGGTAGGIVGDVLTEGDGILAFDRSDEVTFAGQITGSGSLVQQGIGTTILSGNSTYSGGTTISAGTLQLGNGGDSGSIVGDILNNGTLAFDREGLLPITGTISGSGDVVQRGTGATALSGNNSYSGATQIDSGELYINGDQSAADGLTTAASGGTLGGIGTIGGDVVIADGATLSPGDVGVAPGTLTIAGSLTLSGGSELAYHFGQANVVGGPFNDLTSVGGDLVLDGTLNVTTTVGGSFDPGVYRVISYAGSLTDNGLEIGTIPSPDFFVQTAVANQVNLVNTAGLTFNYWDGEAGPKDDSVIDGGDGIWQNSAGNDNWTNELGVPNAPFADSSFAIFMAAPGTVTVDDSLGAINASGMQFASDGYVIQGDSINLVASPSLPDGAVIRVGDGSSLGAGYTATINSVIGGATALVKTDIGMLILDGANTYTGGTAINGGVLEISADNNLGAAGTDLSFDGGTLRTAASITTGRDATLGADGGTFEAASGTTFRLNGTVGGAGSLTKTGAGAMVLTADNSYSGVTTISAGALYINGDQSAAAGLTTVASGATLGGTGIIGGGVVVNDGATLAPGAAGAVAGTLTINGNLTLNAGSLLAYQFGEADVPGGPLNDLTVVEGDLVLDGTLNVETTAGGTFGPGVYRVFNYSGALTNNGLTVGAIPSPDFFVQTSVANQVNLVNTAGLTLNYWDGDAGPKDNGVVNGGDGLWQSSAGNNNWTTESGIPNAPFTDAAFAIFTATPGTVTVDDSLGAINVAGMQFASNGYLVEGDSINLVGNAASNAVIRVGDGTSAGTGMVATIASVLEGDATLTKTDAGTLVLSGANTYTGGTAINGGVLQISADNNLGAAGTALSLAGGTLRTTENITSARATTLGAGGGIFETASGTRFTLNGVVSGSGSLTKAGAGTMVLTAANTYSGGTTISAGTLQLGNGGTSGSIVGNVANNGTLAFNRSNTLTFGGVISGAGAVNQIGTGTTVLTGANTYTGGTTISDGTLQLGSGGTTGSIVGNVANNGTLAFNRSNTLTFGGVISGTGSLSQIGSGTTILTADNSYAGPTAVNAGALYVNGDQSAATGATTVGTATLGGTGTIGGDVTIAGGTLAPGGNSTAPGELTINGDLNLSGGSSLAYSFGQADVPGGPFNDLTNVGEDLTLDGTLDVTLSPGGSFTPGIYRVFNYAGALTDNTLELGSMPPGTFFVQTSVANQVNLVNATGVELNFWDGDAGPRNDGVVNGGDGTWLAAGPDNWTEQDGSPNAPWQSEAFAIFMATSGTVTIDNSNGQVVASGMQFASDGYLLQGGPLQLVGTAAAPDASVIRVGDGTAGGARYTATISAAISGSTTLTKADLGTLVLSGANTYTGGTAIDGGVLQISADNNLGAAGTALSLDGGTLRTTADFTSARATTLEAGDGTFETTAGTTFTLAGMVDGEGALTKTGAGALVLTATNSYSGGTTIIAGTLQLGNGGTTGSIVGNVTNNGTLAFNRSNTLTLGGVISGTGAVDQIGTGTTVLTGTNTYTGGTTIAAGTLQLGNGGTTGSIVGNVANNGTLAFNRSNAYVFGGLISGGGAVDQIGSGITVLTADNSYGGTTDITDGALFINGDQSAATGLTTAFSGGTLGGMGTIGGDVVIANGAGLAPGGASTVPGTLTINGDLTLSGASSLAYSFGQAGVVGGPLNDLTAVGGDLVLDGTLNVVTTAGASFDPGVYRVISYAGSLTNNGLAIGTIPSPGFFVQTSVDHQVNLINTAGLTLNYWDGSVPAEKNNGAVNGGDGVWQNSAGNDNWTNIDGTVNAPFTDASFAVFMATPGTVTVDDSLGDVTVSGMQGGFNRSSQHRYHTVPQGTGRGFRPASSIRASSLASCSRHERRHQVRLSSVD
jgi:fibronectin-binding autotransporter adhesin